MRERRENVCEEVRENRSNPCEEVRENRSRQCGCVQETRNMGRQNCRCGCMRRTGDCGGVSARAVENCDVVQCRQDIKMNECECMHKDSCKDMERTQNKVCEQEKMPVDKMGIGMGYVPWQKYKNVACADKGMTQGTIFEDLVKPFYGCGKNERGE